MSNLSAIQQCEQRLGDASTRLTAAKTNVDNCRKSTTPETILESGLVEAQCEWSKALAEYVEAMTTFTAALATTQRQGGSGVICQPL